MKSSLLWLSEKLYGTLRRLWVGSFLAGSQKGNSMQYQRDFQPISGILHIHAQLSQISVERYKLNLRDNSICRTVQVFLMYMKRPIQLYLHSQLSYTMTFWSYNPLEISRMFKSLTINGSTISSVIYKKVTEAWAVTYTLTVKTSAAKHIRNDTKKHNPFLSLLMFCF